MNDGAQGDGDGRIWHPAHQLPTPGVKLRIRLDDGVELDGVRPRYVASDNDDPDYRDLKGNRLSGVTEWAIR